MSSELAIGVQGLGKSYRIYKRPRDRIVQTLFGERKKLYEEFWALRGADFQVERGESFGIIGKNGSGKSTLLQLIAGTLTPTEGQVRVRGRVAALLELGAGFNPEFTGRENVYMNGRIMGLDRSQIEEKYESIVEFAGIGEFVERPVKTYSSGMFVRLAFAVAASLDPDVLIIDEALSVGDVRFQRKCFRKFQELQAAGVTVLFVTHATDLVINNCRRALFLEDGIVRELGAPKDVVHSYLNSLFADGKRRSPGALGRRRRAAGATGATGPVVKRLNGDPEVDGCARRFSYNPAEYRWGNRRALITDYLLRCQRADDPASCPAGAKVDIYARIWFAEACAEVVYGLTIKTIEGTTVYASNSALKKLAVKDKKAGDRAVVRFSFRADLVPADYFISVGVAAVASDGAVTPLDRRYDMIHFNVVDDSDAFGIADLRMKLVEQRG